MKTILAVMAAVVVSASVATAQTTTSDNSADKLSSVSGNHVVQGCLSRTAEQYVITGGNGPKQYRIIAGDVSSLRKELGHSVEVSGALGKNDPVENMITPYNEGSTTGVGWDTIKVSSIRVLSKNCSYLGFEH